MQYIDHLNVIVQQNQYRCLIYTIRCMFYGFRNNIFFSGLPAPTLPPLPPPVLCLTVDSQPWRVSNILCVSSCASHNTHLFCTPLLSIPYFFPALPFLCTLNTRCLPSNAFPSFLASFLTLTNNISLMPHWKSHSCRFSNSRQCNVSRWCFLTSLTCCPAYSVPTCCLAVQCGLLIAYLFSFWVPRNSSNDIQTFYAMV